MALGLTIDLFDAIEKWIQFRKINEWVKLLISLVSSFWLSLSFVTGGSLIAHRPTSEAIGEGLVTATLLCTYLWRRSPLTKGMALALPADEAAKELETNVQVIDK